ncbi:MAG: hypothetical protein AUG46_05425 [Acidobacteria bacterium 13_1_20CM_3_58_11]|nr:MAG: hypothetical protein AUG46_05425 [Acidobacteria bacterium 13_1_20CM_3_58_11]
MQTSQHRGFTLIELVVVITILGILAGFAIPKFIALDTTARVATVNGLAGSVRGAAALARGLSMATSNTASVTMEGATVNLLNSYPDATATGIAAAMNTSGAGDFTFTAGATAAGTLRAPVRPRRSQRQRRPAASVAGRHPRGGMTRRQMDATCRRVDSTRLKALGAAPTARVHAPVSP